MNPKEHIVQKKKKQWITTAVTGGLTAGLAVGLLQTTTFNTDDSGMKSPLSVSAYSEKAIQNELQYTNNGDTLMKEFQAVVKLIPAEYHNDLYAQKNILSSWGSIEDTKKDLTSYRIIRWLEEAVYPGASVADLEKAFRKATQLEGAALARFVALFTGVAGIEAAEQGSFGALYAERKATYPTEAKWEEAAKADPKGFMTEWLGKGYWPANLPVEVLINDDRSKEFGKIEAVYPKKDWAKLTLADGKNPNSKIKGLSSNNDFAKFNAVLKQYTIDAYALLPEAFGPAELSDAYGAYRTIAPGGYMASEEYDGFLKSPDTYKPSGAGHEKRLKGAETFQSYYAESIGKDPATLTGAELQKFYMEGLKAGIYPRDLALPSNPISWRKEAK